MVQSFNLEEHMTEDAMIEASTSLMDILGMNASRIFQVVGQEIEGLNLGLGSYDNIADEIIELAREQKERNENDGKDAAIAVMEEIQERELERISNISYNNGVFNINGTEITDEEMDDVIESANSDIDAYAQRHGLDEAQKQVAQMMFAELAAAKDGHEQDAILQRYAESNPGVVNSIEDEHRHLSTAKVNELRPEATAEEKVQDFVEEGSSYDDVVDYQAFLSAGSAQPAFTEAAAGNAPIEEQDLELPEEQLAVAATPGFEFSLG